MKIRKLLKHFDEGTSIRVLTESGELYAVGFLEDFEVTSKTLDKKVLKVTVKKYEKTEGFEDSDYPYLEIVIPD